MEKTWMDTLDGIIQSTSFRNEENNYSVLRVKVGKREYTVTGTCPELAKGEHVIFQGEWVQHAKYGDQFQAQSLEIRPPTSARDIRAFLESGLIRGIGPKTAKQMVEHFGKDALHVLSEHPERLHEISGLTDKRIKVIVDSYQEQIMSRQAIVDLQSLGIAPSMAVKIVQKYGKDAQKTVHDNPYVLCLEIEGFPYPESDRIAQSLGFTMDHAFRLQGALHFALQDAAVSSGHCYLPMDMLLSTTERLTQAPREVIEVQLQELLLHRYLEREDGEDETRIYLPDFLTAEKRVTAALKTLMQTAPQGEHGAGERAIRAFEKDHEITFSPKQKEAILSALEYGVIIITGGPGTGKTTLINCIIHLLSGDGNVLLCAPTGRAAKRMSEATGCEAQTIHRLLEYAGEARSFTKNEHNPLDASCVICDEMSMVDIQLMDALLTAVPPGARLILVGDADQLPSVGAGNVLKDLLRSQVVPAVCLTDIFRQQTESRIVVNAHRINGGEMPLLNGKGSDFFFERQLIPAKCAATIIDLVSQRLPAYLHLEPEERSRTIQVLAPQKMGDTGVHQLNALLQRTLNPEAPNAPSMDYFDTSFRVGDKVMQTKNDYMVEWTREDEKGKGIYNGDLGFIESIDTFDDSMIIHFDDDRVAQYNREMLENLDLAYCMSVHKSQGSEFPVLVMPVCGCPPILQTRNLFYTALTRAQQLVVLVGDEGIIQSMVKNDRVTHRYTTLAERLYADISGKYA